MDRSIIDFPGQLFGAITRDWIIDVRGKAGSENVNGNGQVVYGAQPRWEATLEFNLMKRDRVLVWQAIVAKMRGRVNLLRIGVCDPFQSTNAELGIEADPTDGIPHSDEMLFDDDVGYSQGPTLPGVAAAIGATSITLDATPINDALQPGHMFSVNDWLYRVTGITGTSSARTYEFEPPLRRAMLATDVVDLRPSVIVAFASDKEARAKLGAAGRNGSASMNIIEWTNR